MQNITLCPRCQAQNPPGQRFCLRCGTRWCTRCHAILPDKSRYCPTCGFLCGSDTYARASQQYMESHPPQMRPTVPRMPTPPPQYGTQPQPVMPQQQSDPALHAHRNCPKCGAGLSATTTQCFSCGLLIGSSMPHAGPPQTQQMPQQAHHAPPQTRPMPAQHPPQIPAPPPASTPQQMPTVQGMQGQQTSPRHAGGYITGAQAQQGTPAQSIPMPIPRPVGEPGSHGQPHKTPQAHVQQPASAFGTTSPAPAMVNAPVPTTSYGRQSSLPARRDYGLPPARSGLLKTMVGLLIGVILFIPGYYLVTQVWNPSVSLPQLSGGQTPTIQNAKLSSITDTGVIVSWETDKPTTAQVMVCDPTGFCTWTDLQEPLVTSHWIPVDNLKASTTYHLTLLSKDTNGEEASLGKDVTTLAQSDTTPPNITEIDVPGIDDASATITWVTDEPATSQVKYGLADTYGKTSEIDEELTTSHTVTLTGLETDTLYHYRVISTDISGNETISSVDNTLKTLAPIPIGVEKGNRAPDFTLETVDGEKISLKELRGKKVVINFWRTDCVFCVEEMPYFQDIATTWQGDNLAILAINLEESTSTVQAFLEDEQFTFTILLDSLGAVGKKYEIYDKETNTRSLPWAFFIDQYGIIREATYGRFDSQAEIEDLIKSL